MSQQGSSSLPVCTLPYHISIWWVSTVSNFPFTLFSLALNHIFILALPPTSGRGTHIIPSHTQPSLSLSLKISSKLPLHHIQVPYLTIPYLTLPSIYNRRLAQPSPTQPSLSSTSIRTLGQVHSGPADHTFYQSKKSNSPMYSNHT